MKVLTSGSRFSGYAVRRCRSWGRRQALLALGALCLAFSASGVRAAGEDFPNKPITLVVPFAAGGSLDITARILAPKMRDILGQSVVVLNKPGAGSSLGASAVATSAPDGYTLFVASGSAYGYMHLLLPGYTVQLRNFAPIAGIATNTSVFAVNAEVPAKTLPEVLEYAHKNPRKINFCTTGANGLNHLQLEQLRSVVKERGMWKGLEITHVPYNGVAPAVAALKGNVVQVCTLPYSSIVKNLDGNGIRIIAVMRPERLRTIAHVPTTGEQGFPELDGNEALVNVVAPAGTPPAILVRLEKAFQNSLQDSRIHDKLDEFDVQPTIVNAAATKEWLERDVRKFEAIIRAAGLAESK